MKARVSPEDLRRKIEDFIAAYPENSSVRNWWKKPLLVTAAADERFELLPHIAADDHLLPRDLLAGARSVIVYFIPFIRELALENRTGFIPCRSWGIAYNETNELIRRINAHLADYLTDSGYGAAVTPPTANFDKVRLMSRWSHKHIGYIAGLGRFGVNCQLITPSGCTGRLGSLVTDADLGDAPLIGEKEHCLQKRGGKCSACMERCPAAALSVEGLDRRKCFSYIGTARQSPELCDLPEHTEVCGKCQVMLPCSFGIPKLAVRPKKISATDPHGRTRTAKE